MPTYLYAEYLPEGCPTDAYKPFEGERASYRFVFEPVHNIDNFKPQFLKNPKRYKPFGQREICPGIALSFHDSIETSKEKFQFLKKRWVKGFISKLEQNLPKAYYYSEDGKAEPIDRHGHFNFHPYDTFDFRKFAVVADL